MLVHEVGVRVRAALEQHDPEEDLSPVYLDRFGDKASDRDWVRRSGKEFYGGYYSIPSMSVT